MDPNQQQLLLTGGGKKSTYVDDVFSQDLYPGQASTKTITNGIDNVGEGGIDRGGFDVDYNCVNTFIKYNYIHDNLWFCGIMKKRNRNVVIRYNLSQNDKEGIYFYGFENEKKAKKKNFKT